MSLSIPWIIPGSAYSQSAIVGAPVAAVPTNPAITLSKATRSIPNDFLFDICSLLGERVVPQTGGFYWSGGQRKDSLRPMSLLAAVFPRDLQPQDMCPVM
jgi:hypothetical protein